MKRIGIVMGLVILLVAIFSTNTVANGEQIINEDYFADKWEVLLVGTPYGDVTLIFHLTREDDGLKGVITNDYDDTVTDIERISERDDSITFFWTADIHFVNLNLTKQDENNMTGSLMNMFDATAVRIVE